MDQDDPCKPPEEVVDHKDFVDFLGRYQAATQSSCRMKGSAGGFHVLEFRCLDRETGTWLYCELRAEIRDGMPLMMYHRGPGPGDDGKGGIIE